MKTTGYTASSGRFCPLGHLLETALALTHDHRLEPAVAVPRHLDLHRTDLGEHRLGSGAVAGVAVIALDRVVLGIAQVLAHLRLQGGLKHRLGQPRQQPTGADQLDPLGAGAVHELLNELLLINLSRQRLDRLGHC